MTHWTHAPSALPVRIGTEELGRLAPACCMTVADLGWGATRSIGKA